LTATVRLMNGSLPR